MPPQLPVVWIASYPKSGNTWFRFMLYAALHGPPQRSTDVSSKIQDLHRKMPTDLDPDGPLYIKTHFELTGRHPQLDETCRAIHIIRNPRDILLSALNYHNLSGTKSRFQSKKHYAKSFINHGGDTYWKELGYGTWASHARSWRSTTRFPVFPLCYEKLQSDPRAQLVKALEFLGIKRTEDEINRAITSSSFDTMRALEIREKNTDKAGTLSSGLFIGSQNTTRKGVYFMNQGKSNQSLNALSPGLDAQFNAALKDELAEFGYES